MQNDKKMMTPEECIDATLDALQDAGVFDDDEQVDFIQVNRLKPYRGGGCKVHVFGDKP